MSAKPTQHEPAPYGQPTAYSISNISLLQTGYTTDYAGHLANATGFQSGDNKFDSTAARYGKRR